MSQPLNVISEKQKAIKQQRSLFIKIGAILIKSFTHENDPIARMALQNCANKTSSLKDKEVIENFISQYS